jgi:hypothetical protein
VTPASCEMRSQMSRFPSAKALEVDIFGTQSAGQHIESDSIVGSVALVQLLDHGAECEAPPVVRVHDVQQSSSAARCGLSLCLLFDVGVLGYSEAI